MAWVRRLCHLVGFQMLLFGPLLIVAGVVAGCSLIGLGIGAGIDSSNRKPVLLDGWDLERIEKGTPIRVFFRESRETAGVFGGVDVLPSEYQGRYDEWRRAQTAASALPGIGDSVSVESDSGKAWAGAFLGFEYGSLLLRRQGEAVTSLVPYRRIARVSTAAGASWEGSRLSALASEGRLPLRSCMLLDKARIPLEQVSRVEVWRTKSTGKLVGFLVGAVVDAIVIIAVSTGAKEPVNPPPVYYSCPYVYSFDGQGYVREGDVFPGALFRATQLSDRLVLDHLAESAGGYRLRLTNELPETEYLDDIKLVVIDGPDGAPVVPAPRGRFRALGGPLAPVNALDLHGNDVREEVSAMDGEAWIGSPFANDPDRPSASRDGLVLEFPRPRSARSVTLVFRAQPTPWASRLLREVFALHGPNLAAWYGRIEADSRARGEFQEAYRREGQLIVRVWNGASWQQAGVVNAHEAMEMPVDGISGDVLRVRLDSTAGLWSVDSVQADFSLETPLEVTELSPSLARTQRGEDVLSLIESTDGRRHVMEPGHSVDVVLKAAPIRPGRHRSFALKAAGYYTILVPSGREPRPDLFARLLKEPGAFGEYGRHLLQSDLERALAQLERSPAPGGTE